MQVGTSASRVDRRDVVPAREDAAELRTDAEVYAAHEARMRQIYADSFGSSVETDAEFQTRLRRDSLASQPFAEERLRADDGAETQESDAAFQARMARQVLAEMGVR